MFCYKTKQFRINVEDSWFNIDLYIPSNNLVVEVYGDLWHCNPKIYPCDYFNKGYNLTAKKIWEKDKDRKDAIIQKLSCTFVEIWEQDWKKNKNKEINRVKSIIDGIKNN